MKLCVQVCPDIRVRAKSWPFESVLYLMVVLSQLFISYVTELQHVYLKCILKRKGMALEH